MNDEIYVASETGALRRVMMHRPGGEINNIVPQNLNAALFEDIPYLKDMQQEHDAFAQQIRKRGAEVIYVEDMLTEILTDEKNKAKILADIIGEDILGSDEIEARIKSYLCSLNAPAVVKCLIEGIRVTDVQELKTKESLSDYMEQMFMFHLMPLPNFYFMRDAASVIGGGVSIHTMKNTIRLREARILHAIYDYHPMFQSAALLYDNNLQTSTIEGGDILVLNEAAVAVGCSQRTDASGIQILAENIFAQNDKLRHVLAVQLPNNRAFMHLDTVFTMVDCDKFTIYPLIDANLNVVDITRGKDGALAYRRMDSLQGALEYVLELDAVQLIGTGGRDAVTAAREQWNDSTNTFALAPGVVVAYDRNEVANEILDKNGIEVIAIRGSELVRGRGGPRCMTMPLKREKIR